MYQTRFKMYQTHPLTNSHLRLLLWKSFHVTGHIYAAETFFLYQFVTILDEVLHGENESIQG